VTVVTPPAEGDALDLAALYERQRAAFQADPRPSARCRRERLSALIAALGRHQNRLCEAMSADFDGRAHFESLLSDVLGPVLAARHARRHVGRWMRSQARSTELLFFSNRAWVEYQPKGVVGIVSPWNFPVYLALGPLIAAIAAGNRAMIKGSEHAPQTNIALQAVLDDAFGVGDVPVVTGDLERARSFTALPFDHLIFTGATAIGPDVLRRAAAHLTPVTLELGGKSPAVVADRSPLESIARSIAHGKLFNAGQICVAPDYALVPEADVDRFANAVAAAAEQLIPSVATSSDYTSIINDRQNDRLSALVEDARARGATVHWAGGPGQGRRRPLAIITQVQRGMRILSEELFGPILPIVGYRDLDDAIRFINAGPRPLALYPYGFTGSAVRELLDRTHSGGVTINDWGWHVFNHDLPFGGTGLSGTGSYHGVEGFRELSHARAVFQRHRWFPVGLFRPPYGRWAQRWVARFYLGPPT
jgi:coniferyl-aldehyde dehydrogenase